MIWSEIRQAYPNEWLVVEALHAHTTTDKHRMLDAVSVVEHCADSSCALQSYRRLHRQFPARELYFVHTSREELDIREQQWLGIRVNRLYKLVGPYHLRS